MKAVVIFVLLFAVVFCHPVKRSASSSESSEEQAVTQLNLKFAAVTDVVPTTVDTTEDDDSDDDEEDDDTQPDDDDDKDDTSESDESQETTTSVPFLETTQVIYVDTGRGDSMGIYSDSKKSIYYEKGNYIEKEPSSYKSYGFDKIEAEPASKKTSNLKVYKVLQVHDVADQGMGTSSGTESEDPSEQADPQQDQNMKTATASADDNSSPESSEESSEETTASTPSTDGVNVLTGNIETVDSDSANTSSQSSELPVVLLTK